MLETEVKVTNPEANAFPTELVETLE